MYELADRIIQYVKATWRYRWLAVAIAWIVALYGWFTVYRMPDRFEASARVWVDTQAVVKVFMAGITVQPNVTQMVHSVSRALVSRPNMEKVIRMADLDIGLKTPLDRDQLVTHLTRELRILSPTGDFYTTTYADTDSQRARRVVQSLIAIFEERSRSSQKEDAESARRFLEEELTVSKEKLESAEKVVIEFRRRQMLMAGGRDYSRVIEAQTALNEAMLELKIAEAARDSIQKNAADESEIPLLLGDSGTDNRVRPEIDARIDALEQKLEGLRVSYTEQHPDVVAIVRAISQLKEQQKAEALARKPSQREQQQAESRSRILSRSPVRAPMNPSLAAAETNVAAAKARVAEYRKRYDELKAAAIAAPELDTEYARLNRELELARSRYVGLLSRQESARLSQEMETRATVTEFRVVDPPRVIRKGPNRLLLNSLVLLVALGAGVGFAFVLSQVRPSFHDERTLREASGLPVLGSIVMEWTAAQKAKKIRGLIAFATSFVSLLSAYAAILVMITLTTSRV